MGRRVDPDGGTDNPFGEGCNCIDVDPGPRSFIDFNGDAWAYLPGGGIAQLDFLDEITITSPQAHNLVIPWVLPTGGPLVFPNWLAGLGSKVASWSIWGAMATTLQGDAGHKRITLYRGVHAGHPDYPNALKGIANPFGGLTDPEAHQGGNFKTVFTSWSMAKTVANHHANKHGPGGVVLQKKFNLHEVVPSPTENFGELEFLVPGVVTGAKVTAPSGPGAPSVY